MAGGSKNILRVLQSCGGCVTLPSILTCTLDIDISPRHTGAFVFMYNIGLQEGLLDKKHVAAMGSAVWLFMWCVARMTKIEGNVGFVLGGKPIKHREIEKELGIPRITYARWLADLKKSGYIKTVRTHGGLILLVSKAKKFFVKGDVSKMTHLMYQKRYTDVSKMIHAIKTIQGQYSRQSTSPGSEVEAALKTLNNFMTENQYVTCDEDGNEIIPKGFKKPINKDAFKLIKWYTVEAQRVLGADAKFASGAYYTVVKMLGQKSEEEIHKMLDAYLNSRFFPKRPFLRQALMEENWFRFKQGVI